MGNANDDVITEPADRLGAMVPLVKVRADLETLEAIEDEIEQRVAELRAILPPGDFRRTWALRDAEQRLGLAERLLAERRLVEALARCIPEHAAAIRAVAGQRAGDEVSAAGPS